MINNEIISYIKGQLDKGVGLEQIKADLMSQGGWSLVDVDEALKVVLLNKNTNSASVPISPVPPSPSELKPKAQSMKTNSFLKITMIILIVVILGVVGFSVYKDKFIAQPINTLNNVDNVTTPQAPESQTNEEAPPALQEENFLSSVADCGTSTSFESNPKALGSNSFNNESDATLVCLGKNIINDCQSTKGIVKSKSASGESEDLPSIYEVQKVNGICMVKSTYSIGKVYSTGEKIGGKYIQCPVSLINKSQNFSQKPGLYAATMFVYNSFGAFFEGEGDPAKVRSFGCSGDLIDFLAK